MKMVSKAQCRKETLNVAQKQEFRVGSKCCWFGSDRTKKLLDFKIELRSFFI